MRWLHSCLSTIRRAEELCLAGAVLAIALLNLFNVAARSLLGTSIASVEELSRFSMIWITFVGLGYAASRGRHIRMTAPYDALPERARKHMLVFSTGATSVLCFYLCKLSLTYIFETVRALGAVSPVLEVPKWLVYLAVPLGLFLAGVQYALACARNVRSRERYVSFTEQEGHDDAASSL